MNDEIKEILDNFEKYEARYKLHNETQFIITHREIEPLYDYITNLQQNYDRIYNENCKLREEHNITDIGLLDENQQLKKQKDDVVEYVNSKKFGESFPYVINECQVKSAILRMLGEKDNENN